jgi:hypothetical protein
MSFSSGSSSEVYQSGMFRMPIIALVALLLATAAPVSPGMAQGGCVSNSEGHQLVAQGQAITFPEAASRAGIEANQVVGVQLCQAGGGYVYRVRLRDGRQANIPAN